MKRFLPLVLALTGGVASADDAAQLFQRVAPAVVTVTVLDEASHVEGHGSGVVVATERVVTNCHVVRDARVLKVRSDKQDLQANWLRADLPRDLCLLEVPGLAAAPARLRASASLATGERVFAVGNPLGFGLAVSEGLVSTIVSAQSERRIYTSAALSPGSSGGGLFDAEARLVGITTAVLSLGQNLNVALPAEWIDEIATRGMAPPTLPVVPPPEPAWQAEAEQLRLKRDWTGLAGWAQKWSEAVPKSPVAWQALGLAQQNLGRFVEAERNARSSLALHDKNEGAWVELGLALNALGRKEDAEASMRRAMALQPSAGYPHSELGRIYLLANRLEDAKREIDTAIQLTPGDFFSWSLLGYLEEKRGNAEAASRAFRVAVRHRPDDHEMVAALARTLSAAGQSESAREVIIQSPGAAKMNSAEWNALGATEFNRKRYTDAENAYRKALEADPRSSDAWTNLALVQFVTGRTPSAEASLDKALAIQPDHLPAMLLRAERRVRDKDFPAARTLLERIVASDPKRIPALRLLGNVQFETRDFRAAEESFRRVTILPEPLAEDWLSLANVCLKVGKLPDAETALQNAERLAPENVGVLTLLAALHGNRGNNERALAYAERVIAADPSAATAWSSKGYALLRLGRLDEAARALETAVGLAPDSSNAWINLGQTLLQQKQLGKAITALERAIKLSPQAADAQLYLVQAYLGSKQYQRGRSILEELLRQQPESVNALGILTMLNLIEGKGQEAQASYLRMKTRSPFEAANFRASAIGRNVPGAAKLSE